MNELALKIIFDGFFFQKVMTKICLETSSKKCSDLLDTLERITLKPLMKKDASNSEHHEDVAAVVLGLIKVVCARICQLPSFVPERAYKIVSRHLEANYDNPKVFGNTGYIRLEIFRLFMRMRTNETFHLGFAVDCDSTASKSEGDEGTDDEVVHFSPFIVCRSPSVREQQPGSPGTPTASEQLEKNQQPQNPPSPATAAASGAGGHCSITYLSLTKVRIL